MWITWHVNYLNKAVVIKKRDAQSLKNHSICWSRELDIVKRELIMIPANQNQLFHMNLFLINMNINIPKVHSLYLHLTKALNSVLLNPYLYYKKNIKLLILRCPFHKPGTRDTDGVHLSTEWYHSWNGIFWLLINSIIFKIINPLKCPMKNKPNGPYMVRTWW